MGRIKRSQFGNLSQPRVTAVAHFIHPASYNKTLRLGFREAFMESMSFPSWSAIRVLVADSNQMECQLWVGALRQRPEFDVICCAAENDAILQAVAAFPSQTAIINIHLPRNESHDMTLVRRFHVAHPEIPKIVLIGSGDRDIRLI